MQYDNEFPFFGKRAKFTRKNPALYIDDYKTYRLRYGERHSLHIDCSASVSQNSHASKATFSSLSCVRINMY